MNWLQKWMYGRYGMDALNRALIAIGIAAIVLEFVIGLDLLYFVALALLGWCYYRMFSRNYTARLAENERFTHWWTPVSAKLRGKQAQMGDMRTHLHCKCPACKQKIRVPRGRGRISITCPVCRREFIKKT